MKKEMIFITGFFGAPVLERAQRLAAEKNLPLLSLDEEIQKADGRSVQRICMVMGEHEYRNKEYEALQRIISSSELSGAVICCGDGVLLDDMSRALLESCTLLVLGGDMSCDALWQNAKKETDSYHAFLHFGTEEKQRASFDALYERQKVLFAPYIDSES